MQRLGLRRRGGDSAEELEDEEEDEDEDDVPISDDESEAIGTLSRPDGPSVVRATVSDAALAYLRGEGAGAGEASIAERRDAAGRSAPEGLPSFSIDAAYALFEETRLQELAPIGLALSEAKGIVREDWNALGSVERARLRVRAARAAAGSAAAPAPRADTPLVAVKAPPPPPPRKWLLDPDRRGPAPVPGLGGVDGFGVGRTGSSSSSSLPPPALEASTGPAPEAPSAVAAEAASMPAPVAASLAALPPTASGSRRVLAAEDGLVSSPSLRAKRSPVPNPKRRRYDDGL